MNADNSAYGTVKQSWLTALTLFVAALAVIATAGGIVTAFGQTHRTFVSLSGEIVNIQGGGLYGHESVSMAAQGVGMDLVTLLVATPLLLIAGYLAARGSLRGRLLSIGAFWYFTYAYLIILFGAAFNPFFLIYAALLSASLLGLVLSILRIDTAGLPARVSPRFARRTMGWVLIGISLMFAVLWLSRILPALLSGKAPAGLDSYTTLSVQAADLAIVIPMTILIGALLLRRLSIGYLFAFPAVLFLATMGLGLVGMVTAMAALGIPVTPADFVPAGITSVLGVLMTVHLVLSIQPAATTRSAGHPPLPTAENREPTVGPRQRQPSLVNRSR